MLAFTFPSMVTEAWATRCITIRMFVASSFVLYKFMQLIRDGDIFLAKSLLLHDGFLYALLLLLVVYQMIFIWKIVYKSLSRFLLCFDESSDNLLYVVFSFSFWMFLFSLFCMRSWYYYVTFSPLCRWLLADVPLAYRRYAVGFSAIFHWLFGDIPLAWYAFWNMLSCNLLGFNDLLYLSHYGPHFDL